jgi:apolipoprotein N-acyltransferase
MESLSRGKLFVLYGLSGILLGIGFIFPWLWIGGLFGIAIFIYSVNRTNSKWEAVRGGFVAWTLKSLMAIFWFWSTYPIEWIDLSLGKAEAPVVGFYWLSVSCFIGLGGVLVATFWWFLKKPLTSIWGLFIFPILWLVGEIFGSLMFSFFTLGEGITVNSLFSFGYSGYLLGNHALLILLAKFGGVYVLSLLAAFIGYLGILICESFSRPRSYLLILAIVVIMLITGFQFSQTQINSQTEGEIKVAIIDTKFGGEISKRENYEIYKREQIEEAVKATLALKVDYIILPEDTRYTSTNMTAEIAYRYFRFKSSDAEVVLIDSGRAALSESGSALRATIYDGLTKKGWVIDKQYLVPQGEFMPYFYQNILAVFGMKKAIKEIQKNLDYRPGPFASQAQLPKAVPAILFCFESADPYAVRRLTNEREVSFVAHPISHAWFHESKILWHHFDLMLKIQALWNNVPIVSAGNMVKGALYNKEGNKIQTEPLLVGESWQVSLVSL